MPRGQVGGVPFYCGLFLLTLNLVPFDYITIQRTNKIMKRIPIPLALQAVCSGKATCPKPDTVLICARAEDRGTPALPGWPVVGAMQAWGCRGELLPGRKLTARIAGRRGASLPQCWSPSIHHPSHSAVTRNFSALKIN